MKFSSKKMKNKSNKLKKLEKNRYSIFTDDLSKCFINPNHLGHIDKHEVYGGANRIISIKNGLVVPLCRQCHSNEETITKLKEVCQKLYEKEHTREEFIKLIGRNYLDE